MKSLFSPFNVAFGGGGGELDDDEKAHAEKFAHRVHASVIAMSATPHMHKDLVLATGKEMCLLRAEDGA